MNPEHSERERKPFLELQFAYKLFAHTSKITIMIVSSPTSNRLMCVCVCSVHLCAGKGKGFRYNFILKYENNFMRTL